MVRRVLIMILIVVICACNRCFPSWDETFHLTWYRWLCSCCSCSVLLLLISDIHNHLQILWWNAWSRLRLICVTRLLHIVRTRIIFQVIFTVRSLFFLIRYRRCCWRFLIGLGWGDWLRRGKLIGVDIGIIVDLIFGIVSMQYATVESHWGCSELLAFLKATSGV